MTILPNPYLYLREHRPDLLRKMVEIGNIVAFDNQGLDKLSLAAKVENAVAETIMILLQESENKTTNAAFDERAVAEGHRQRRAARSEIINWLRHGNDTGRGTVAWDETVGEIRNELADTIEKTPYFK